MVDADDDNNDDDDCDAKNNKDNYDDDGDEEVKKRINLKLMKENLTLSLIIGFNFPIRSFLFFQT